jgi:hypothetical protein
MAWYLRGITYGICFVVAGVGRRVNSSHHIKFGNDGTDNFIGSRNGFPPETPAKNDR